jgi:ubiquinone/menaquinone biosynthesis C-methylase UbiE
MVPGESWNPQMEIEHWNRYMTFQYLAESRNVLDVACGEGYGTALLSSLARTATGIDLSEKSIEHAINKYGTSRDNLKYAVEDACNLPPCYGFVDVVYCFETIEHVKDIPAFVAGLVRVVTNDGVAIISTPKPRVDPSTGRPFNPYHVRELSAAELEGVLRGYFGYVALAGQSKEFPCEIHQEFNESKDSYVIGVASNNAKAVETIIRRLPGDDIALMREKLFRRQFNRIRNFQEPARVLFVPLVDRACSNPSDRRRILLPAEFLRNYGAEVAVVNKENVLNVNSNVIYSQDRDYRFWLENIDAVTRNGRRLVFSFSDAIGLGERSWAHSFDAYCEKATHIDANCVQKDLGMFLEKCCAYVFAGSDVQKRFICSLAPGIAAKTGVLADPIDVETYNVQLVEGTRYKKDRRFTLIWEGFCDNVPYLLVCANAIRRLGIRIPLKVIVVCSGKRRSEFLGTTDNAELVQKILGAVAEFHTWDVNTISELMAIADVGLAPAFMDCSFAAAKPENKAVIYNYMKLPVVASPTQACRQFVRDGANGFIAATQEDWERHIEYLYCNPQIRRGIGEYGHKIAAENYSVEAIAERMLHVFLNDGKHNMDTVGMR